MLPANVGTRNKYNKYSKKERKAYNAARGAKKVPLGGYPEESITVEADTPVENLSEMTRALAIDSDGQQVQYPRLPDNVDDFVSDRGPKRPNSAPNTRESARERSTQRPLGSSSRGPPKFSGPRFHAAAPRAPKAIPDKPVGSTPKETPLSKQQKEELAAYRQMKRELEFKGPPVRHGARSHERHRDDSASPAESRASRRRPRPASRSPAPPAPATQPTSGFAEQIKMFEAQASLARQMARVLESKSSRKRTEKVTDPAKLNDGITGPSLAFWRHSVLRKLRLNHDHYDTEEHRIALVESCTEGKARDYITAANEQNLFMDHTAEEIIDAVDVFIADPMQLEKDIDFYKFKLEQSESQPWSEFIEEFKLAAMAARIPYEDWATDVWNKMSTRMQGMLLPQAIFIKGNFEDINAHATQMDYNSAVLKLKKNKQSAKTLPARSPYLLDAKVVHKNPRAPAPSPAEKHPVSILKNGGKVAFASSTKPPSTPASDNMICYRCHRPGHIARDCVENDDRNAAIKAFDSTVDEALEQFRDQAIEVAMMQCRPVDDVDDSETRIQELNHQPDSESSHSGNGSA